MIREGRYLMTWEDEDSFKKLKTSVRLKYYQFIIVFLKVGPPKIYDVKNGKFLHIQPFGHICFTDAYDARNNKYVVLSNRARYNFFAPQNKSFLLENFT